MGLAKTFTSNEFTAKITNPILLSIRYKSIQLIEILHHQLMPEYEIKEKWFTYPSVFDKDGELMLSFFPEIPEDYNVKVFRD